MKSGIFFSGHKNTILSSTRQVLAVFVVSILFLFTACEKDPLIAHDCGLHKSGLLCKTYIYEGQNCIGFVMHNYNMYDSLIQETYHGINEKVRKKVTIVYDAQRRVSEIKTWNAVQKKEKREVYAYDNGVKISKRIFYDDKDVLFSIHYIYNDLNLLQSEDYYGADGLTDSLITYEYDSAGHLWRKSYFSGSQALRRYEIHVAYDNMVGRILHYNSLNVQTGHELLLYDNERRLLEHTRFNFNNEMTSKKVCAYENGFLVKIFYYNALLQLTGYEIMFYS